MQPVIQYIEKELNGLYPSEEIKAFIRIIFEHVCGFSYTQFITTRDKILSHAEKETIERIVIRLKMFEPIQYILGETEFYGLRLNVNPSVLIPRQETEELVQWILETNWLKSPAILDIGTGSGCIALALQKELPAAEVNAVDFSVKALETAHGNAQKNRLQVNFIESDILKWRHRKWENFDVIVSNPPYVRELEKEKMQPNVLEFEPATALFVSDSDPLIFYREISKFALKYLQNNGFLFFEINESLGKEMIRLLSGLGFKKITIKRDLNNKERMLCCQR